MSDGFPITPTGSPGEIESLASELTTANAGFSDAASTLRHTSSGLGGVDWSGDAEERFTVCAGMVATAASTYHDTLAAVGRALASYGQALQTAQRVIEEARTDYETAKRAQADAHTILGSLRVESARSEPDERRLIGGQIEDQESAMRRATQNAADALTRATEARERFDRVQDRARGVLEGTTPTAPSPLGPFGRIGAPSTGGGVLGAPFGLPPGGLDRYTGVVPWNEVYDVDPYSKNTWDEKHNETDVSDFYDAALALTGIGGLLRTGAARGAGRAGAGRAAASGADEGIAGGVGAMNRLEYIASPKHGPKDVGIRSKGPRDGQLALDNSLQIKPHVPRRVGVDWNNREFVVFDRTLGDTFHGHVRTWKGLDPQMRKLLVRWGLADKRGRIL